MHDFRIQLRDLDFRVRIEGQGPPLVLAHGGMCNLDFWRWQVPALRDRFTVITYTLRGHGDTVSVGDHKYYSIIEYAHDLEALRAYLRIERFYLAGLSLGGFIVQEYTLHYPERVAAVGILDSGVNMGFQRWLRWTSSALCRSSAWSLRWFGVGWMAWLAEKSIRKELSEERVFAGALFRAHDKREAAKVWRGLLTMDTADRIGNITCPALVLNGENEHNLDHNDFLVERIPNARRHLIPHASHITNLENKEEFNAALGQFFDDVQATDPLPDVAPTGL